MVGMALSSALFRCQDPGRAAGGRALDRGCGTLAPRRASSTGATAKANGLGRAASTALQRSACLPPLRGVRAVYRARMDLDRMREIACGAVEVGSSAVLSGRA